MKAEILAMLRVKYRDTEDMVYWMELSYEGILDILDLSFCAGSTKISNLPAAIHEISDSQLMLKSLLPMK